MKQIKYIGFLLLLFGVSGLMKAQKPEFMGLLKADDQKLAAFRLQSDAPVQAISADIYRMQGEGTQGEIIQKKVPVEFFRQGTEYYFLPFPEPVPGTEVAAQFLLQIGEKEIRTSLVDAQLGRPFDWVGSDVKSYQIESAVKGYEWIDDFAGWGFPVPFNKTGYSKGITAHAPGYFLFDIPEDSPYDMFRAEYGTVTYDMGMNASQGGIRFTLIENQESRDGGVCHSFLGKPNTPPYSQLYSVSVSPGDHIKIQGDPADGNNTGDVMGLMMARFYYKADGRQEQKIENGSWPRESVLDIYQPQPVALKAQFTSGEPVLYRIVSGEQYATIKDGNILDFKQLPENDYVEVEAFQPGNATYKPSDLYRQRFSVTGKLVVHAEDKYVIRGDDPIQEMIVYGNNQSVGQVVSEKFATQIKKLILKYTFVPGEWNFISFPANVNIEKISDLNEKGYTYNTGDKAFYIMEYSTRDRAENPDKTAWKALKTPVVEAHKGYIMGVSRSEQNPNNEPVEITFELDNDHVQLDLGHSADMRLSLDFREVNIGDEIPIYIDPVNAKGNTLQLYVRFQPKDKSQLPLNYSYELQEARVTYNPDRSGIRLTLPTSDPAKVLIFNKRGKMVRAVRYESPQLIDIRNLESGTYDMLIEYGHARAYKTFEVE